MSPKANKSCDLAYNLAEHVVKIRYADLPQDIIKITKLFILDTVGCAIAGTRAPGCDQVKEVLKDWGGNPESSVIGSNLRLPSLHAAFLNGMLSHALDFDEVHDKAVIHAYAPVLPSALALVEARADKTGKDLILATVIGVDLLCRLGLAFDHSASGFFPTSTCGALASTAASAKIIGLDKDRVLHAFGIAYNSVSGNRQCIVDGALTKRMLPALSAKVGVWATLLAEKGITGATNVLEGKYGFFRVYADGKYNRDEITDSLGKKFEGRNLSIKPFPCCRLTHPSIEAVLNILKQKKIGHEAVKKIEVHVPKSKLFSIVSRPFKIKGNPQVNAQFSIPYTVAVATLKKHISLGDFEETAIRNKNILDMARRVKVARTLKVNDPKALTPVLVEIEMKNGQIFSKRLEVIKGQPQNPMNQDECIEKFRNCLRYSRKAIPGEKVETIIDMVLSLEKVDKLKELTRLLR